tara:strand:+ start:508 stop:1641 length:1134 start_codon:yes stop_codon:yes gene_type:complete
MNFKQRGEKLREIITEIRERTFEYEPREVPKINWTQYDQAQIWELATYLDNVRDLVDEAKRRIERRTPPKERGPGRPPINPADITKVLLLQAYTGSPNRVAEGLLLLFWEKLGINQNFSYKTIERGYDREAVNEILDEVTRITNETVKGKEVTFSFDGTGFSASNKENYAAKRQKQNSKKSNDSSDDTVDDHFPKSNSNAKMSFTYSVIGVGVQYKLISGMATCPNHFVGETSMFPEVFQQTISSHPQMEEVLGDGIYAARWIVDMVSTNDARPYFLPPRNVTFKSKGFSGWWDMLFSLQEDPQEWLNHFHMRSISETVNSMIKCRFGNPLRKRLDPRKETETRLKLVAHDIRRVGYLEIFKEIKPHWPRKRLWRGP